MPNSILFIGTRGHMAPDPVLQRFNTPEGSMFKGLKTPQFAGSQRRSDSYINWRTCHYIVNSIRFEA